VRPDPRAAPAGAGRGERARSPVERLNALPDDDAVAAFLQCCASQAWARTMAALRPYRDADALFAAGDRVWHELGPDAWREAFHGHPRIGERAAATPTDPTGERWSAEEQAGMSHADDALRAQLATVQRAYEARFGHIFLICATGRTAADMLAALHGRLGNDPDTELRIAAEEQRKITRLRLEKLLTP
jgi:OHCU decarboxylase